MKAQATKLFGGNLYDAHIELHGRFQGDQQIEPGLMNYPISQRVKMQLFEVIRKASEVFASVEQFRLAFIEEHGTVQDGGEKRILETITEGKGDKAKEVENPKFKELMEKLDEMLSVEYDLRKPVLKPEDFESVPGTLNLPVITSLVEF